MMGAALASCFYCLWTLHRGRFVIGFIFALAYATGIGWSLPRFQGAQADLAKAITEEAKAEKNTAVQLYGALLALVVLGLSGFVAGISATDVLDDWSDALTPNGTPTPHPTSGLYARVERHWHVWLFTTLVSLLLGIAVPTLTLTLTLTLNLNLNLNLNPNLNLNLNRKPKPKT